MAIEILKVYFLIKEKKQFSLPSTVLKGEMNSIFLKSIVKIITMVGQLPLMENIMERGIQTKI